jgi:hypothetical protein
VAGPEGHAGQGRPGVAGIGADGRDAARGSPC